MVHLGDTRQSVIIRGEDRNNPVLLLVHGGPGSAETPKKLGYPSISSLEDTTIRLLPLWLKNFFTQ